MIKLKEIKQSKAGPKEDTNSSAIYDAMLKQQSLGLGDPRRSYVITKLNKDTATYLFHDKLVENFPEVENPYNRYPGIERTGARLQSLLLPPKTVVVKLHNDSSVLECVTDPSNMDVFRYALIIGASSIPITAPMLLYVFNRNTVDTIFMSILLGLLVLSLIMTTSLILPAIGYEAPIPLIPSSISTLAERAKKINENISFHLVMNPSWTLKEVVYPQSDPILVAESEGRWYKIGYWNGDEDLLKEV